MRARSAVLCEEATFHASHSQSSARCVSVDVLFFIFFFFFTNRGTDFARKEGLRLVHLERKSVISYQSFLFGTHTFVFSFSSFQCSVCHTLRSLKVFWNTFTMIFLRVVV